MGDQAIATIIGALIAAAATLAGALIVNRSKQVDQLPIQPLRTQPTIDQITVLLLAVLTVVALLAAPVSLIRDRDPNLAVALLAISVLSFFSGYLLVTQHRK